MENADFRKALDAIVSGDVGAVKRILTTFPDFATHAVTEGATRENPTDYFVDELKHYIYAGDSSVHLAAMAHRPQFVELFVKHGADVHARNRRGAQPIHYAADGSPNLKCWDPEGQYETVAKLIELGADPNAFDKSGVAPLHRAVRNRCSGAVKALIKYGANVNLKNKSGSTPLSLSKQTTGKSGSGSAECKRECEYIVKVLEAAGAK